MRSALILLLACAACGSRPAPVSDPADPAEPRGDDPHVSDPAVPDEIRLGALDGTETSFEAVRTPVTVVAMWATFCAPCLRELPLLEALYQAYRGRDDVSVVLVSIDDFEPESRAKITRILAEREVSAPAFIDYEQALIERLAPRDAQGEPYYAVPMVVVVDEAFRLRREMDLGSSPSGEALVATVGPLVEAALRGEDVAPEEPYEPPLGSSFTQRSITLTVHDLEEAQIEHYLENLRHQLATMYPDLHDHQLDDLMVEVEAKLREGGTFRIDIPAGHRGPH